MKVKKEKGKPILARARKPAEAAALTPAQKFLRPIVVRWRIIAVTAAAAVVIAGAVGGYFWYVNHREDKAARAYARLQGKTTERITEAAKKAGKDGRVDEKALKTALARDLDEFVKRYGNTGTGRAAAFELASLYFDQGDYKEARARFDWLRGRSRGPEALLAEKGAADCARAEGDIKGAITIYQKIYNRDPDGFPGVPVGMALAACYVHEGRTGDAEEIYRRILDYNSFSPYAPEAAQELTKLDQVRKGAP
jgi:tetratricopeptide (TPR) repeat protein